MTDPLRFDRCSACHVNVHRDSLKEDCKACHTETTFRGAPFDHSQRTKFALDGKHGGLECAKCHPTVSPREVPLARKMDGAHFAATRFSHVHAAFALTGKHETTDCTKCHRTDTRAFPAGPGTAMVLKPMDGRCQSCHADVHLGQVDTKCEACHQTSVFKLTVYTHKGLEDFFAGFHGKYACVACHKSETGVFPAGRGTAVRLQVGRTCIACHVR